MLRQILCILTFCIKGFDFGVIKGIVALEWIRERTNCSPEDLLYKEITSHMYYKLEFRPIELHILSASDRLRAQVGFRPT